LKKRILKALKFYYYWSSFLLQVLYIEKRNTNEAEEERVERRGKKNCFVHRL